MKDKSILRELAKKYAEITGLSVQEKKRRLWRKLNGLKPERPMVMIDNVCWSELEGSDELKLQCNDPECRNFEQYLRRNLYQWHHFPVDSVMEPCFDVYYAVKNSGFGVSIQEVTISTDPHSEVVSHKYKNLFQTYADLEKIKIPVIEHDRAETDRHLALAHEIFDGILDVNVNGSVPGIGIWDVISTLMGVEDALLALIDKPEFMHEMVRRFTEGYTATFDQLEEQGLLPKRQNLVHCAGAYTDELPAHGYNSDRPRCKDIWNFGLAQMLSTVSPQMFDEFEVAYTSKICKRFGLIYYGCCEPLDGRMNEVKKMPNVRKVSMSPWANHARGAEEIGVKFVFSSKPNPAHIAMENFCEDLVRKELLSILEHCRRNSCPLEFILKDISTVRNQPDRLDRWAKIAMEVAEG